ncbi:MAG: SRPBCC family protein, partial [Nitrospiraceae bacterium]
GESCGRIGLTEEQEMLVTVQFQDRGNSTDVALTHELFLSAEERDKHSDGWTDCLNRLAHVL